MKKYNYILLLQVFKGLLISEEWKKTIENKLTSQLTTTTTKPTRFFEVRMETF